MRKEYYDIYEILYSEYVYESSIRRRILFPFSEYSIIRAIRKSIDDAGKEYILRPDAKYFLIVNFHHLIVRPLIEQMPFKGFAIEKELLNLEENIQYDIKTIISESKMETGQGEISGHQIMKTIDKLWMTLKTTKLEIWG